MIILDHFFSAVQLSGEPNKALDPSMRSLRSDVQHSLKCPREEFQWPIHAALLRKLSKVVDIKSDVRSTTVEMNGSRDLTLDAPPTRRNVTLADVSVNTTKSLNADDEEKPIEIKTVINLDQQKSPEKVQSSENNLLKAENTYNEAVETVHKIIQKSPEKKAQEAEESDRDLVVENVTVEIQHNITPKKSSLKLDLKKGTSQLSTSLLNISSQIKSVTTHKRIVSRTDPKKSQPCVVESFPQVKQDSQKSSSSQSTPKSAKCSRPLVNTKSPNVLIYSDSVAARDNLESSLRKVLDCDR